MVLRDTANTGGFLLGLLRLVEGISSRSVIVTLLQCPALLHVVGSGLRSVPAGPHRVGLYRRASLASGPIQVYVRLEGPPGAMRHVRVPVRTA